MIGLIVSIILIISISALCSLLEALVLSSSTSEIETLKATYPKRGVLLERFRVEIEETSSAILTLNTIANVIGALWIGSQAAKLFDGEHMIFFSIAFTIALLIFSEILPKNIGVLYRRSLQSVVVYPLYAVRLIATPLSWICKHTVRFFLGGHTPKKEDSDEAIIMLAKKSAQEGSLSSEESDMIRNTLAIGDLTVGSIYTPRTVVFSLESHHTVESALVDNPNPPFARIPVFEGSIDRCVGIVRRQDLLAAKNRGEGHLPIGSLMSSVIFVPENASIASALKLALKEHQQILIVVDEFGSTAGVLTMEDIVEAILGQEIIEQGDLAVDMRELARKKHQKGE
jgi:CBS domain containing-hemolysin-like protein